MTTREAIELSSKKRRHGGSVAPPNGSEAPGNASNTPGLETAKSTESEA